MIDHHCDHDGIDSMTRYFVCQHVSQGLRDSCHLDPSSLRTRCYRTNAILNGAFSSKSSVRAALKIISMRFGHIGSGLARYTELILSDHLDPHCRRII